MTHSDPERRIRDSWVTNAEPWIHAVRAGEIESRRLVTDAAIVNAVLRQQPASVLDLGCGEGWLARELAADGIDVLGVDAVPELIEAARSMGGGSYLVASYEEIGGARLDVSVDVVVCNFSLIGGTVVDQVVEAIPAMLNPGGALVVQTLHPVAACGDASYEDGWREGSWDGFSSDFRDPAPWYFRTTESWLSLFQSAGLRSIETREPRHPDTDEPLSLILMGRR